MRNIFIAFIGLATLLAVIIISLLVSEIGGISIRSSIRRGNTLVLSLSEPILRGVPINVSWADIPAPDNQRTVTVILRGDAGEEILATSALSSGQAQVVIPCDYVSSVSTLIFRDSASQEVLANQSVTLMPAGPECIN